MWIDHWQQMSGGAPFAVGDTREFFVVLVAAQTSELPAQFFRSGEFALQRHPTVAPAHGVIGAGEGMTAWWSAPRPARGPDGQVLSTGGAAEGTITVTGLLEEDHHSRRFVSSRLTVRRILLASHVFALDGAGVWQPQPDSLVLSELERTPRRFVSASLGRSGTGSGPRGETGLLIEVEPARTPTV